MVGGGEGVSKTFRMEHLFFESSPAEQFDECNPPEWLVNDAYKWWWIKHVLPLEVGASIKSDFRKITRTN